MNKQNKKMIAPIVITILIISYFIFYMWMSSSVLGETPFTIRILLLLIPIALIIVSVSMLIERINEIKEG